MKPKMGRPIVGEEPKDKQILFRATKTTVNKLKACAEYQKMTKTEVFEKMVDEYYEKNVKK